jgi:dGTPase
MSDEMSATMDTLRTFLYEHVYRAPRVHQEFVKAKKILTELFGYYLTNDASLHREMGAMELSLENDVAAKERTVCDFIASLTDRNALNLYEKIFFPSSLV